MKYAGIFRMLPAALLFLIPCTAQARDLGNKLGFGFSTQLMSYSMSNSDYIMVPGTNVVEKRDATNQAVRSSLQALSVKYAFSPRFAVEGISGFMVGEHSVWGFGFGLKLHYNIFYSEENVNFYVAAGPKFAILSGGEALDALSIMAAPGVEFFIPGVDSLGFFTEFGLEFYAFPDVLLTTTSGNVYFGMHYYF